MEHIKVIELPHKSAQGATYTLLEKVNEVVTWINEHDATISISPTGEALASCCTDAIAPALTMNAPAWISVKDRLPESGKRVLLACENRGILKYQVTGSYHACNKSWYVLDWSGMGENIMATRDAVVTHWMPLPEFPK